MRRLHGLTLLSLLLAGPALSQTEGRGAIEFEHLYDIPSKCSAMTMTMRQDALGRPFLYVAAKEGGLRIYDIAAAPRLVRTIPAKSFRSLHVMNLSQSGERLFLALGNHFTSDQSPGLAVIDVSDPGHGTIADFWFDPRTRGGAGIVVSEGGHAYLGAMGNGLLVFEISDQGKMRLLSRLVPSVKFPDPRPDPTGSVGIVEGRDRSVARPRAAEPARRSAGVAGGADPRLPRERRGREVG